MFSNAIKISATLLLILFLGHDLAAQKGLLRRGDRSYEALSYTEAIGLYELAFARGAQSVDHARRLADCHWNLRDLKTAGLWYASIVHAGQAGAEDLYRYAEILRMEGKWTESDKYMVEFQKLAPDDSRGRRKASSAEKLALLLDERALSHKVDTVPFNSDRTDMAPFIRGNEIYFASARMPEYLAQKHHTFNDQPFLNLYTGSVDDEGAVSSIKPVRGGVNTGYHESNAVISPDGQELYFTRNATGSDRPGKKGTNNLQIQVRKKIDGGWSEEKPFEHNDPAYSLGHPAISRDGSRLFFTSDRTDGVGGKDIWYCDRQDNGKWSAPKNLGSEVNTEGDEMFPYVHGNFLYFASDGHLGFGGLDLFRIRMRGSHFGPAENLGSPINGPTDDFGLCLDRTGDIGFFTSDRKGGIGGEDIYTFRMNSRPEHEREWVGRVMDENDAHPIAFVQVQLFSLAKGEQLASAITGADGHYAFPAPKVPAWLQITIPGGQRTRILPQEITVSKFGDTELPDVYLNSAKDLPFSAQLLSATDQRPVEGAMIVVRNGLTRKTLYYGHTDRDGKVHGHLPDRAIGDTLQLEITFSKPGYFDHISEITMAVGSFEKMDLTAQSRPMLTPVSLGIDLARAMGLQRIFALDRAGALSPAAENELTLLGEMLSLDRSIQLKLHAPAHAVHAAEQLRRSLLSRGIEKDRIVVRTAPDGSETTAQMSEAPRFKVILSACDGCSKLARMR